jgi:hypothetical protein
MKGVEDGMKKARKMNEIEGSRLTGFARNLLWEGLALVSPCVVNQQIFAGRPCLGGQKAQVEAIDGVLN